MHKLKFAKYYYNDDIEPYSRCYDLTEFIIDEDKEYICVERKYYTQGHDTEIIRGKALVEDIAYRYEDGILLSFFINVRNCVEYCYKDDLFIDGPQMDGFWIITIDDKEYKLSNSQFKDSEYESIMELVTPNCAFINIPTKLLKQILSNSPFGY